MLHVVVATVAFFSFSLSLFLFVMVAAAVVVDDGNPYLMSSSSFIYAIDVLFTLTLIICISSKFKLFYLIGGVNSTIFHRCELSSLHNSE